MGKSHRQNGYQKHLFYEVRWQGTRRDASGNNLVKGEERFDAKDDHAAWAHVHGLTKYLTQVECLNKIAITLRGKNNRLLSGRSFAAHQLRNTVRSGKMAR